MLLTLYPTIDCQGPIYIQNNEKQKIWHIYCENSTAISPSFYHTQSHSTAKEGEQPFPTNDQEEELANSSLISVI